MEVIDWSEHMARCSHGHTNPVDNAFCGTCGEPLVNGSDSARHAAQPASIGMPPPTGYSTSSPQEAPQSLAPDSIGPAENPYVQPFGGNGLVTPANASGPSRGATLVLAGSLLGLVGPPIVWFTILKLLGDGGFPLVVGFAPSSRYGGMYPNAGSFVLATSVAALISLGLLGVLAVLAQRRSAALGPTGTALGGLLLLFAVARIPWSYLGLEVSRTRWDVIGLVLAEIVPSSLVLAGGIAVLKARSSARRTAPPEFGFAAGAHPGSAGAPHAYPAGVAVPGTPAVHSPYAAYPAHHVPQSSSGTAVTSLVLSILGLLLCGPLAIVGIVLGHSAKKEIRGSGGATSGDGVATAGIVIGWISTVLWGLGVILLFAVPLLS